MTPAAFLASVVVPGAAHTAPTIGAIDSSRARCMLLAIAGQESGYEFREQKPIGYAHGWWQMERLGGIAGVMADDETKGMAAELCHFDNVVFSSVVIWNRFSSPAGDNLAFGFARLLLWSDVRPLPAVGDEAGSWDYYIRTWRPGKPSRERWSTVYPAAAALFGVHSG